MQPGLGFVLQKLRFVSFRSESFGGQHCSTQHIPPSPFQMSLINLRTFGRSGLIVSPLSLSTMIFGTPRGGRPTIFRNAFSTLTSRPMVILSTPPMHAGGRSEELVGGYIADRGLRDQLVLATKFDFSGGPGNPNAGGNGRKNIHCALEGSPRRLQTDYVDLYWLHVWDMVTPVEEVLQTLGDLMRGGKTRYFGFSDMPAWYAAKAATLAAAHVVPGRPGGYAAGLFARREQHRVRVRARGPRVRPGHHAVEPAGGRLPGQQVPAR